ncbi:MAG TPA: DUF2085 domain-containing protein [Anaerolineae bacterium]|nr:DUF2085 domain-containing protein [Anaerolineae bacterium]
MNALVRYLVRHWLAILNALVALYAGVPWLAPVLMRAGRPAAARAIYAIYAPQCHQLAQRSFFLFGRQLMYSLPQLQATWPGSAGVLGLRAIVGNAEMGWKVAWSDRMVAMYGAILAFGLLFGLLRRWLPPAPLWLGLLLLVPMALDGGTHFLSDLGGLEQGFRATNSWLAQLTGHQLPASFYAGDALGSFNSWMRLVTGILFGLAVVWVAYPRLERLSEEWEPEVSE